MFKKILIALTMALLVALGLSAVNTPTQAALPSASVSASSDLSQAVVLKKKRGSFNDVTHAEGDTGNIEPIHIRCGNGEHKWLYRGMSSPSRCGSHVDVIIASWGQWVVCRNALPPYQNMTITGVSNVPSWSSLKCWSQNPR